MPSSGLDPSWTLVQTHGFKHAWQFGADIVFTYGPWGFLATTLYDPATYLLLMAFWTVLALALAAGILWSVDWNHPIASVLLVSMFWIGLRSGLMGRDGFNAQLFNDPVFFVLALLALVFYAHPDRRVARWTVPPLLALVALSALVKFSFALLGLPVVLLIELTRVARRRFVPVYLVWYLVCVAAFFAAGGQGLTLFPAYVSTSLALAAGYSEAMQLPSVPVEVMRFLGLAACLLLLGGHAEWKYGAWRRGDWRGAALLAAFALFVFLVFKAGFVRHDAHSLIAWSSLTAGAALYAAWYLRLVPSAAWRTGMLGLCLYLTSLAVSVHTLKAQEPASTFLDANFGTGLLDRGVAAARLIAGERHLPAERDAAIEQIRAAYPMPALPGSVDVYPWNAAIALAHGVDYRPRPVYQSYAVFNARLIAVNRAHLEGDRAPRTIIFDMETIDGRFLPLEEGPLWPAMIARYDVAGAAGRALLLRRRAVARDIALGSLQTVEARWGRPIAVPSGAPILWATISLEKTVSGKLLNILYKLPGIAIAITTEDGRRRIQRLVPDVARQGFVLTPVVESPRDFASLFEENLVLQASGHRVVQLELLAFSDVTGLYRDAIQITFQGLSWRDRERSATGRRD